MSNRSVQSSTSAMEVLENNSGDTETHSSHTQHNQDQADVDTHDDRRRHSRVSYRLKARYLDASGQERPCVVANISAGGAMVRARKTPKAGEKVILYIDGIGRFEGDVIRSGKHAFAVKYKTRRAKSQRTADALIRVLNRGQHSPDHRITPRIELDDSLVVTTIDGLEMECTILDISLTGASISIDPQPPLGTEMGVGRMKARVVRRHENGVGVVFLGSVKHMEDVIQQTTKQEKRPNGVVVPARIEQEISEVGTEIASHFGKKNSSE